MQARNEETSERAALSGVRVLDFTERIQGPYGTQILGDLGAEIIKIERPQVLAPDGQADSRYGRGPGDPEPLEGTHLYTSHVLAMNRNKKSVAIDLKSGEGRAVVERLVALCDVVYENFRPGVMERLGVGYEQCRELNPSIVYASASGYGPDGPYVHRPGQDVLTQAIGGFGAINVSGEGRPTAVGMSITDVMGGMNGATAVLAALFHRERTGEGQRVSVNLLDSAIAAQSEQGVHFLNTSVGEPRRETAMHAHPYIPPPYGFYATKDGYLALSSGRQISEVCRILEIDDLSEDPRFSEVRIRDRNRVVFEEALEAALSHRTTAEWMELMEPEDIFAAPVKTFEETFKDPQVVHNEMVVTIDSPIGDLRLVGPPYKFSRTPATIRTAPPLHGQHTIEILRLAGYDDNEIDRLQQQGAVVKGA
ncbi:MAG: CoA transferase [Dehalococcoidia bacterium]